MPRPRSTSSGNLEHDSTPAELGYVQTIMTRDQPTRSAGQPPLDPDLLTRLKELCHEGWEIWSRFDVRVRSESFHPFVAADYEDVLTTLISVRAPGQRFLEWGSATGVITIMADLLGFEAYGIELDAELVAEARRLADAWGSGAHFATGSLLPTGYRFQSDRGGERLGTIGSGTSGYLELGHPLEDFDVVYGFPWSGEEAMMLDLMKCYGRSDALLLLNTGDHGMTMYRGGRASGDMGRSTASDVTRILPAEPSSRDKGCGNTTPAGYSRGGAKV